VARKAHTNCLALGIRLENMYSASGIRLKNMHALINIRLKNMQSGVDIRLKNWYHLQKGGVKNAEEKS